MLPNVNPDCFITDVRFMYHAESNIQNLPRMFVAFCLLGASDHHAFYFISSCFLPLTSFQVTFPHHRNMSAEPYRLLAQALVLYTFRYQAIDNLIKDARDSDRYGDAFPQLIGAHGYLTGERRSAASINDVANGDNDMSARARST
jgi:hypothetical protein